MKPQKITVKIPRKQGEMIPFDLDKWNTGEYEAVHQENIIARMLCTDNAGNYPIVVAYGSGRVCLYTIDGRYAVSHTEPRLFLRKKSSEELPKDMFCNVYNNYIGNRFDTLDKAHEYSLNDRLAIIHITCEWEDAV